MDEYPNLDTLEARIPFAIQLPTAQQVAAGLTILALMGPAALGGIPVLPVTIQDERRRQQDEIQQTSESSVGIYHTSQEAAVGLAASQRRLALVTKEVNETHTHDVSEQDVVHAADRVFAAEVRPELSARFLSALNHVATDTADLCMLRDDETYACD
jgi:hypothetical protein